jgi:hypothetical protein
VSFSIAQKGPQLDASQGSSTVAGAGTLVRRGAVLAIAQGGQVVHTDAKGGIRIELKVLGGSGYASDAAGAAIGLDVKVSRSNDRECKVGALGALFLTDARDGGDQLLLDVCDHHHVYANGDGDSLAVGLAPATPADPVALVRRVLARNAKKCRLEIRTIRAERTKAGSRVTAGVTTFGNRGTSIWTVVGSKVVPANQLASEIAAGCP